MAPTTPTVAEFSEHWLNTYCRPPYRAAYLARARRMAFRRYFNPLIGEIHMEDVSTAALSAVQRGMFAKGLKLSTVRTTFGFFSEMWKAARAEGMVRGKPYSDLVWPKARKGKPTVFTREERDDILLELTRQRVWWLPQAAMMLLAGMRPSEAAGMRWRDLDARTGRVEIERAIVCREETGCKHEKAVRSITVSHELVGMLVEARPRDAHDDDLMSRNHEGGGVDSGKFSSLYWRPFLKQIGMPYRVMYAARHTFITLAIMDGADAAWVAQFCGTSIQEIERSYLSWIGSVADPSRGPKRSPAAYRRADRAEPSHFVNRPSTIS